MSDIKRVKNYKKSRQPKPPISPAEHRRQCEYIVDSWLMPVVDKLMKSPADIQPVSESFETLLAQIKTGVPRQPYVMNAGGRRLAVCDDVVTELEYQPNENASKVATKNASEVATLYSAEESAILEKLNAEISKR
jgi:hypothetical protein